MRFHKSMLLAAVSAVVSAAVPAQAAQWQTLSSGRDKVDLDVARIASADNGRVLAWSRLSLAKAVEDKESGTSYNVVEVLKCYLNSLESADKIAHCHFLYRDLAFYQFGKQVDQYRVPCRMLQGFTQELVRDELAPAKDRAHAAGVRRGSFWCPHFEAKRFGKISGDTVEKDRSPKLSGTTLALTSS